MSLRQRACMATFVATSSYILLTGSALGQTTTTDSDSSNGVILLFCIGLPLVASVAVAIFMVLNRRSFQAGTQSTIGRSDAIQRAIQVYTMNGWRLTGHTDAGATFYKDVKANWFLGLFLMLFGLIPGIIYLVVGSRDLTATVHARQVGDAMTAVEVSGNARGFGGASTANKFVSALPLPSGYSPQSA